jgi:hypothetical protein
VTLGENDNQTLVNRIGAFIGESKNDDARLVEDTKGENVAEVEIEGHEDAAVCARPPDQLGVWSALEPETPDMHHLVTELIEELDGLRRDSSVCQKPHASRAQRVQFVLSQRRCVHERLTDIFFFEVG